MFKSRILQFMTHQHIEVTYVQNIVVSNIMDILLEDNV